MSDSPPPNSPVFAVYFPDDIPKSPREVFLTLKEATKFAGSPEAKSNGARFKRFGTPKQAMDFLAAGDSCVSPLATISSPSSVGRCAPSVAVPSEPTIPHPSVSRIQMTEMKKSIEKDDWDKFTYLIETNPRYLINTSGDTATIVMEGFRFNALHIAAKSGRANYVEKILERVSDIDYLIGCYGTDKDDVTFRRDNIISSYLNTPDKGCCDTPLHIASKWGKVDVIRVLTDQSALDRNVQNKEGSTPMDVACSRYHGEDKTKVKSEIELLLSGCFVALYRSPDNNLAPKIVPCKKYPAPTLDASSSHQLDVSLGPVTPKYVLSACAGPFRSDEQMEEFHQKWTQTGKDVKRSDIDKGHERIGRDISSDFDVKWSESWFFLPNNRLIDINCEKDLSLINVHLADLRRAQMGEKPENSVRRVLNFDDDEEDSPSSLSGNSKEEEKKEEEKKEEEDDLFEDASDQLDPDDSIASLTGRMAGMVLATPPREECDANISRESEDIENEEEANSSEPEDDNLFFCTPPSSPPTVFLLEEPTKADNDLFLALSRLSSAHFAPFPSIRLFVEKMSRMTQQVRVAWPSKDSPRRQNRPRSRLFSPRS